ncbi:MAG: hypothetical protein HQM12_03630 [SAR324 cluster bacterium]|nr:hypothetical protein [SAR324 cluster bacterium]
MLMSIEETRKKIEEGEILFLAGDEDLLKQLPRGKWIGGSIPYFMDTTGGITTKDKIFASKPPAYLKDIQIQWYNAAKLSKITADAPENGFSVIIIPATSKAHVDYAEKAPGFENIFLRPIIGWIAGVHLSDLGKITPKTFNGMTGDNSDQDAVVMHVTLPPDKLASIGIVNIFQQGNGDTITFDTEGFSVNACYINGKKQNFADYVLANKIDTRYPLVANYCGAMVNVSFQAVLEAEKIVNLYAPVFQHVEYKLAAPVADYVKDFQAAVPAEVSNPAFSCNCILNFLYSELEGKKTGDIIGPMTFGEVAYQLLNQTMVYVDIMDV